MKLAGTGHRPDKLGGYTPATELKLTTFALRILSDKHRLDPGLIVLSGMALGWDQALAEAALILHLPYWALIPFEGFEQKWPQASRDRLFYLRQHAAHEIVVCEPGYAAWKLQQRNKALVDNCDQVLALWNGTPGGTANCLEYARPRKPVENLWDQWEHGR